MKSNVLFKIVGVFFFLFLNHLTIFADVQDSIKAPCQTLAISGTHINCYGGNNGAASITITNGVGPFTITWSNGATNVTSISNLTAGYYDVYVVSNTTGCAAFALINITQPPQLNTSLTVTDVACFGGNTGNIQLNVTGGTTPYSYNWSNGPTTQNNNNLSQGTYGVTVTDARLCQTTNSAQINQPAQPLGSSYLTTEVLCNNGSDASVDMSVWGGTPPYTFNWNSGTYFSEDLQNLASGIYNVLILDSKNCQNTHSISIANPPALVMGTSSSENDCFGDENGEITLNVLGGTLPYSYTWANSTYMLSYDTSAISQLPSEHYYVSVTDANGCEITQDFVISNPPQLQLVISGTNVSAFGGTDGQIYLTVTGGVSPYSFIWSNSVSTQNNPNVPAGIYDVQVIDANGCSAFASIVIQEPLEPLMFSYITRNVTCHGATDGQAFSFASGGVPPYLYLWSTGSTLSYIDEVQAGTYILTITDFNGITFSDTILVFQPDPFVFSYTYSEPTCFGLADGQIDLTITGGTQPYYYQWYNSDYALAGITEDLPAVSAGMYTVMLSDTNGCPGQYALYLNEPSQLTSEITGDDIQCTGGISGSVTLTVDGGIPPYAFFWSNSATSQNLSGVGAGTYTVTISDDNGCLTYNQITLSEPSPIDIELFSYPVSCIDQMDGYIISSVSGGSGGYTYFWSNGEITADIFGLYEGTYSVMVTDIYECTSIDSIYVSKINKGCITMPNTFTPNGDGVNDTWVIQNVELYPQCNMQIFNKWGNIVFESIGYTESWDGTFNGSLLPSGTYYFIFSPAEQMDTFTGTITIVK